MAIPIHSSGHNAGHQAPFRSQFVAYPWAVWSVRYKYLTLSILYLALLQSEDTLFLISKTKCVFISLRHVQKRAVLEASLSLTTLTLVTLASWLVLPGYTLTCLLISRGSTYAAKLFESCLAKLCPVRDTSLKTSSIEMYSCIS